MKLSEASVNIGFDLTQLEVAVLAAWGIELTPLQLQRSLPLGAIVVVTPLAIERSGQTSSAVFLLTIPGTLHEVPHEVLQVRPDRTCPAMHPVHIEELEQV